MDRGRRRLGRASIWRAPWTSGNGRRERGSEQCLFLGVDGDPVFLEQAARVSGVGIEGPEGEAHAMLREVAREGLETLPIRLRLEFRAQLAHPDRGAVLLHEEAPRRIPDAGQVRGI